MEFAYGNHCFICDISETNPIPFDVYIYTWSCTLKTICKPVITAGNEQFIYTALSSPTLALVRHWSLLSRRLGGAKLPAIFQWCAYMGNLWQLTLLLPFPSSIYPNDLEKPKVFVSLPFFVAELKTCNRAYITVLWQDHMFCLISFFTAMLHDVSYLCFSLCITWYNFRFWYSILWVHKEKGRFKDRRKL